MVGSNCSLNFSFLNPAQNLGRNVKTTGDNRSFGNETVPDMLFCLTTGLPSAVSVLAVSISHLTDRLSIENAVIKL